VLDPLVEDGGGGIDGLIWFAISRGIRVEVTGLFSGLLFLLEVGE